jgi:Protein of unknown function (DUF1176)
MRNFLQSVLPLAVLLLSPYASAQYKSAVGGDSRDVQGIYFQHKDWEVACDNTRTCRAAGYPAEGSSGARASILLSRKAGANTPIEITFKALNEANDDDVQGKFNLQLGETGLGTFTFATDLSEVQTRALLPKLLSGQQIELVQSSKRWKISLAGLSAAVLKIDESQKRIGTPSALSASSRGTKDEPNVVQPLPIPVINVPRLPPQTGIDKVLIDPIKKALPKTDCSAKAESISIEQLNDKQVLVEVSPCERAAYNEENAYFIANIKAPHSPKRINFDNPANEYSLGVITGFHKGRGVGDCVSTAAYAWDGIRFVKANVSGSGMCRGFLGGAWDMPTVVSIVNNPNLAPKKKK